MTALLFIFLLTFTLAIIFDVINGLHDASNSIATIVSTQVLSPKFAVLWASFFNFIAFLVFAPHVADTISKIITIDPKDPVFVLVIFSGLVGAIIWDLLTWWLSLPVSSSHALIGGLAGAGLAYMGVSILHWDTLILTFQFIILSPLIGFVGGIVMMIANIWFAHRFHPLAVDHFYRKGQLVSAALYSLGHGANDAQKTMGVLMALLFAAGFIGAEDELALSNPKTGWIILTCNLAMALGTAIGGWRIVKTVGMKITKLRPIGGFSAETSGALTLFLATNLGIPVSTTQTIAAAIFGVGSVTQRPSNLKWDIIFRILWAWVLTIPASGIVGAGCFVLMHLIYNNY